MSSLLQSLWQANIDISLLLIGILLARFLIRKTTKVYNAYLLWLSIPTGLLAAWPSFWQHRCTLSARLNIRIKKPPIRKVRRQSIKS